MSKRIRQYMTASPHCIAAKQPMSVAHDVMRNHEIRHLPVLEGGKLVGLVSLRDLHLLETLQDVDPKVISVEEAMSQEVYAVTPDTTLAKVAEEMAERRIGSAVVMEGRNVVGVFTNTDALRALAELMRGG